MWVVTTKKDVLVNITSATQITIKQFFNTDESLRGTAILAHFADGPLELAFVDSGDRADDRIPVYMSTLLQALRANQSFCDLSDLASRTVTFAARLY